MGWAGGSGGLGDVIGSHSRGLWKGIWLGRGEFWDRMGYRVGLGENAIWEGLVVR